MKKTPKNGIFGEKGQVAIEYALAVVVMAAFASLIWIFYQGLSDQTFYGSFTEVRTLGIERTVSLPFP